MSFDLYTERRDQVMISYRKNWFRWFFDPSWRALAVIDAHGQGMIAVKTKDLRFQTLTGTTLLCPHDDKWDDCPVCRH